MDHIRYYVTRSEGTNMANQTGNKYAKPNVTITEDDASVTLDFEQFTITVQRKS